MVRRRMVWWYRDYAKKDFELANAIADAEGAKCRLRADKVPVPPWTFRRNASTDMPAKKMRLPR